MKKIELSKVILQKLLMPFSTKDSMDMYLTEEDRQRLKDYQSFWNFYTGYHWEEVLSDEDKPETTTNWCGRFVNKYVATEFNSGFLFKFDPKVEETVTPFLNNVWDDNNGSDLMAKVGQTKSVTGDAYVQVFFESPDEIDDPFGMYPEGRIRLFNVPSSLVFPKYKDGYDDSFDALESVTIMYPTDMGNTVLGKKQKIIRFVYTKETITKYEDGEEDFVIPNKYGVIPIVPFRNLPLAGTFFGQSDLKDLIALNTEYNLKNSDVSQILDYNSAPSTIVQGAKPHNIEKGANKIWCVPEKAKVYNLELKGDLVASNTYIDRVKDSLYNIGSMPKLAIGGESAPSNLSGLALEIAFMPLTDLISQKRVQTAKSVVHLDKIILKMGLTEGLIKIPSGIKLFDFYNHSIWWGDILPRDERVQLEMVQSELKAGLTTREEAMTKLYKDNVTTLLSKVDEDVKKHPQFYGIQPVSLPNGNRLVSTFDGRVIAKAEQIQQEQPFSNANPQVDLKNTVGRNRDGEDRQQQTGLDHTNPPKES